MAGKNNGAGPKQYWAAMTPEERSAEMKRRMQVRYEKLVQQEKSGAEKFIAYAQHERNGKPHGKKQDYSNHISYLFGKAEALIEYYADNSVYLGPLLPTGWEHFFSGSMTKRGPRLKIRAADGTVPPPELSGYQKWRWAAVYEAMPRQAKSRKHA